MTATIYCALTVYQILGRDFIHVTTNFDNTPKLNIVNTALHVSKQSLRDFCDNRNYIALQNQNPFLSVPKVTLFQDFPGGPVGKTLCSQCRGPRFDTWSGN